MRRNIYALFLYRVLGWRLEGELPQNLPRALLVFLPHTSNWDFVIGWLFIRAESLDVTIFGKDAFNFFPLSYGYRFFGVVPIKRNLDGVQANDFVAQVSSLYDKGKPLWTAMAPEGARSQQAELRSGYYFLAKQAGIKIIVVGPDFENKKLIVMPAREVKPSYAEDQRDLIEFSERCRAKRPENGITF